MVVESMHRLYELHASLLDGATKRSIKEIASYIENNIVPLCRTIDRLSLGTIT